MSSLERSARTRLKVNLERLSRIKASDLAREELRPRNLDFHAGLPYFERTLALFRALNRSGLAKVPSAYLELVAEHAEHAVNQFEEILRFTGDDLVDPFGVRTHLIAEVRDYYRQLHDDLSILIPPLPGQQQRTTVAPWYEGAPLAVAMFVIFAVGVAAAYRWGLIGFAAQDIVDSLRDIAHR
ncbi:MAG TPA: hypothetical protein VKT27_15020 [Candidatus Binataceae bacterium]|nr:hypothetical protein [Candidatus Binataceae bacterium]